MESIQNLSTIANTIAVQAISSALPRASPPAPTHPSNQGAIVSLAAALTFHWEANIPSPEPYSEEVGACDRFALNCSFVLVSWQLSMYLTDCAKVVPKLSTCFGEQQRGGPIPCGSQSQRHWNHLPLFRVDVSSL